MLTGILEASNELICVIDGDGQKPPMKLKSNKFLEKIR